MGKMMEGGRFLEAAGCGRDSRKQPWEVALVVAAGSLDERTRPWMKTMLAMRKVTRHHLLLMRMAADGEDADGDGFLLPCYQEPTDGTPLKEICLYLSHFPGAMRQKAYIFDGLGNYFVKEWDLAEGRGNEFCWYHVELPKGNQKLSLSAQYLIEVLCPPLKLQDILALVTNGPFCGYVDGALIFRVNSPGPAPSPCTLRLAARVTENSVITMSLGRIPRLGFSPSSQSLLSDIPSIEQSNLVRGDEKARPNGTVIFIRDEEGAPHEGVLGEYR